MQKSVMSFLLFLFCSSVFAQVSLVEKEALKTLYDATDGPNWISETDADANNDWDFSGPVTEDWYGIFLGDGHVETVRLFSNNLKGYIPESIGDLYYLKSLFLESNELSGTMPESLGNLQNLVQLYASSNDLSGPIPQSLGNLGTVNEIQLEYNSLDGPIPQNLGEAPNLTLLYLSNNKLSGPIPESLGDHIAELLLDNNQLTGTIPENFSRPDRRWFAFRVNNNKLEGKIPDYLTKGKYNDFQFANNRFEFGGFEADFNDYKNNYYKFEYSPQAKVDDIETQNLIAGSTSTMVTNCSGSRNNYQWFKDGTALSDGGAISGATTDILNVANLKASDTGVYYCEVTSAIVTGMTIERNPITLNVINGPCEVTDRAALMAFYIATDGPNWMNNTNWNTAAPLNTWYGVRTNAAGCVTVLDMNNTNTETGSNNLSGTLPQEIGNLRSLRILDLSQQNLTGNIPQTLGSLENLTFLDLSKNELVGEIPTSFGNLSQLEDLILEYNELTGDIPTELGNLERLEIFLAQYNLLSGEIPNSLGNLGRIRAIWLNENQLTGSIPASLGNLQNITQILLNNNDLSGEIPPDLGGLEKLEALWLGNNRLSGEIPDTLGNLKNLEQLDLQWNQLVGPIPNSLGNLEKLITLVLGNNPLTGIIPVELGNLLNLEQLYIYSTGISGTVPKELGQLTRLRELWLAFNALTGEIPNSLKNLRELEQLVLQNNHLTGEIPQALGQFPNLRDAVFSNNQLQGPIPSFSSPFLDNLTFEGNRFQFGDFEDRFDNYSEKLSQFLYDPQAKINEIATINANTGKDVTLTTTASGNQNHYQWFKNGVAIEEAPDSPDFTLINIGPEDAGVYHCEVTSDIVTDLTLVRNDIFLDIFCSMPLADDREDITTCKSYALPALSDSNFYYTAPHGTGTLLAAGDVITETHTIYIYTGTTGCSDENSFTVTIEPSLCKEKPVVTCQLEFPKFFTPNNDGQNDFFEVVQNSCGQNGILNIYDRYGKLLFQGDIANISWDGTYNGNYLPATDYWYRFTNAENVPSATGHFTLKR